MASVQKAKLKDYIQLMRPQATLVSVFIAIAGFLLGGGSWLSSIVPLLVVYAFIFHWAGFANNEIEDLEYDKCAGKDHKALVKGKIPFRSAMNLVLLGQVFAVGLGALIAGSNILAWFWMLFNIVNGILYNMYCKTSFANPIFIANCWMGLGLFGYFTQTATTTPVVLIFASTVWLMFFYDVAYLGYYKDPQDEKNILIALGSRHDGEIYDPSKKAQAWGWSFKLLNIGLGAALWILLSPIKWVVMGWMLASTALLYVTKAITQYQKFNRRRALSLCALSEMATYSVMIAALGSVIGGPVQVLLAILLPILFFVGVNRYIWGKGWGLAPNV